VRGAFLVRTVRVPLTSDRRVSGCASDACARRRAQAPAPTCAGPTTDSCRAYGSPTSSTARPHELLARATRPLPPRPAPRKLPGRPTRLRARPGRSFRHPRLARSPRVAPRHRPRHHTTRVR
jgi:hypothetical protein